MIDAGNRIVSAAPALAIGTEAPTARHGGVERLPVQMFATVMGIGGIGNAWRAASRILGVPSFIGSGLLDVAAALFAVLTFAYAIKLLRHFQAVAAEFRHPVKANFFGAISVSAMIISIGFRDTLPDVALATWIGGAGLHIVLAVTFIRRWVLEQQDEVEMTPAWFIPVAGNFLVPVGGVPLGFIDISWFFFSVALIFWLVLFTIAMHRVVFCAPMSERSVPTLFILLAPPSIGLSAYFAFTHGDAGFLAHILYCFGLFIAILIATLANRFWRVHFFLSWWAMTFPSSAWATATVVYYRAHPTVVTQAVAWASLAAASAIVIAVFARTMRALVLGQLFNET